MSKYKFVPNQMAREAFNLAAPEYVGEGITSVLQSTLGEENYQNYMVAQDPLCGGKTSGTIRIILNRREENPKLMRFESIGTIYKLD